MARQVPHDHALCPHLCTGTFIKITYLMYTEMYEYVSTIAQFSEVYHISDESEMARRPAAALLAVSNLTTATLH